MASFRQSPNYVLASLPAADFERMQANLRPVDLLNGDLLIEAGAPLSLVYFPLSGIISSVVSFAEGETTEVSMVGRNSVFGASAALNGASAFSAGIVRFPGKASAIGTADLCALNGEIASLRDALMQQQWTHLLQTEQNAACNASHTVGARLCRQLLRSRDLAQSETLPLTQEILAQMLGARRNTVSLIAHTLQQAGIIRYSRGQIAILNGRALTACACECYEATKAQDSASPLLLSPFATME
jgi:CRP-like cAMP-binding protein